MDNLTQPKKILSSRQLSLLSHEELVSQLLAAHEKIQELEAKQHVPNKGTNANNGESVLSEDVSRYPVNGKSQAESIFAYSENHSTESVSDSDSPYQDRSEVIKELQEKLHNGELSGNWLKPVIPHNNKDEDFIVAYECKGNFPYCDEDLATPSLSADEEDDIERPKIIINDGLWEDDEFCENDEIETFPLIPSPVLNTPPYEYIFLTKTNEAKYRIFLNQKLNKVFQEEILKLKIHEEQLQQEQTPLVFDDEDEGEDNDSVLEQGDTAEKETAHTNHQDLHNQNHIVNSSSINEVTNNLSSTCNVIHCFDPSDVDLDLKKIFMEKPPITHKIVRRKSRRDRGSSVPAVDSYYGTKDLNKVGHASYFIPTLTESERKAIGWKHEYHYGHWKYATLNVPNPKNNQVSLHPHVEGDGTNHHNNHNGTLPHNPLHHHEIDISEASESLNDSCIVPPQTNLCSKHLHQQHHCNHGAVGNRNEDTLSFITLSGCSREASQSCHIIPDKGTLRKILQWLLPCIKQMTKSKTTTLNATTESGGQDHDQGHLTGTTVEEQKEKTYHEIETLVEPSRKLIFQTSNINMSLIDAVASGSEEKAHDITNRNRPVTSENDKIHIHNLLDTEKGESLENHHHIHSHHHHHGIFHWKNILTHHGHSEESMSVVGGDVIESMHDYIKGYGQGLDVIHVEMNESPTQTADILEQAGGHACNVETGSHGFSDCTTDSESEEEHGNETTKSFRKLKPCKAHFKLLTLKDIGYETDENDDLGGNGGDDNGHDEDKDRPGSGGNSSYPGNGKDISSVSSRQEFICRNKRCDELSNRAHKPIRGTAGECGKAHRRGERCVTANRITSWSSEMTGNDFDDGDLSSGGSGYPFSSLSVSHQNSIVGSNILEECDSLTLPELRTSEEIIEVETRFLDPKDSLTLRMGRTLKTDELVVEGEALPFVYEIDNSNTNEEQQEEVKEWMGGNFMEEIEEGLGLLSSCLESIMKHDAIVNAVNEGRHVPDKVEGQHKMTTLNDLEDQKDGNKNY